MRKSVCVCMYVRVLICMFPKFSKMAMSIELKFSGIFCMNLDIKIIIAFDKYDKYVIKLPKFTNFVVVKHKH